MPWARVDRGGCCGGRSSASSWQAWWSHSAQALRRLALPLRQPSSNQGVRRRHCSRGGALNDLLALVGLPGPRSVLLDGGAGTDTLIGPAIDSTWTLTGDGAGTLHGVTFAGFENLTGAPDTDDTFVIAEGGSLSGGVDGGDRGFDVLDVQRTATSAAYTATGPQSGIVTLDGVTFTYAGLEPITVAGTDELVLTLSDADDVAQLRMSGTNLLLDVTSGTAESHSFAAPTKSLTINLGAGNDTLTINVVFASETLLIQGQDGSDTITLISFVATNGGSLDIEGDTAAVFANPELISKDVDTVTVAGDANPLTVDVDTQGGDFTILATFISVADTVTIAADNPTDPDAAGAITFWARRYSTAELENLSPVNVDLKSSSVTIGSGVAISGGEVFFLSYADDKTFSEIVGAPNLVDTWVVQPVMEVLTDLTALPIKVLAKASTAGITIGTGSAITATGTLGLFVSASADSTGSASFGLGSIAFGYATAEATVTIGDGVHLTAGNSVNVNANAAATANMSASTGRELGDYPGDANAPIAFSLAITYAKITSTATVAANAVLTAGKVANVRATGEISSEAEAESGLFSDGSAGLAGAVSLSFADITTTVDGAITALAEPGYMVKLEFDPTVPAGTPGYVDPTLDAIYIGPHALVTGDAVSYSNRPGTDIGGIDSLGPFDGQTYYILQVADDESTPDVDESVLYADWIRLAENELAAWRGIWINLYNGDGVSPATSVAAVNSNTFDQSNVKDAEDTITLTSSGFTGADSPLTFSLLGNTFELGQAVRFNKTSGADIGGLTDGGVYYVITETNQFNLSGDLRPLLTEARVIRLAESENESRAGVFIDLVLARGADGSVLPGAYTLTAFHVLDSDLATGLGVISQLDATNSATATAGLESEGDDPPVSVEVPNAFNLIAQKLATRFGAVSSSGGIPSQQLSVAGALAFVFAQHTVTTTVNPTAVLKSNEDLEVKALLSEALTLKAESSNEPQEEGNPDAPATGAAETLSVALGVAVLTNTATATVDGAHLDALRALRVISDVRYPYLTRPDELLPSTLGEFIDALKTGGYETVTRYLDAAGLVASLFNVWVRATGKGEQTGVAGSASVVVLTCAPTSTTACSWW